MKSVTPDIPATESEKALAGFLYDSSDRKMTKTRRRAKRLYSEYNRLPPKASKKRRKIIRKLFGKIGKKFLIEAPFYCDYGKNIEIGNRFFSNMNLVILDGAKVKIGDNVMIAPNVGIYGTGHPFHVETRNRFIEYSFPVTIGNNVWIGGSTVILPGVAIGDNSVIGAGSVVTKDVPANTLAFGNPCRIIRTIDQEEAARKEKYFKTLTQKKQHQIKKEKK